MERALLGDVARLDIDRVPLKPGARYRIAGVFNSGSGLFDRDAITSSETNYPALHRLRTGQLVMRKLTAFEGAIACVPPEFDGYFVSTEFPTYTVDEQRLDPAFMALICRWPTFWEQMWLVSTGTVQRRKRVNPDALLSLVIPLPSMEEQRRIVDLIASADRATAAARNVVARSRVLTQCLLDAAIDEAMASGATVREIRDIAAPKGLIGGPFGSSLGATDYVDEGIPVIRGGNLSTGTPYVGGEFAYVSAAKAEELRRNMAAPGDIIATQRGTIGQVGIVPHNGFEQYVISQSQMRLRVDPALATPEFAYLALRSSAVQQSLQARTIATANPHINLGIFASTQVVVPKLEEQRQITELVFSALRVAVAATSAEAKTLTFVSSVLDDLLAGAHVIAESYDKLLEHSS